MDVTYEYDYLRDDVEYNNYTEFERSFNQDFERYMNGEKFVVSTSNHGWQNKSGCFDKEYTSGEEFIIEITNGVKDPSLKVEFTDGLCCVTLHSHDNTQGTRFELREA